MSRLLGMMRGAPPGPTECWTVAAVLAGVGGFMALCAVRPALRANVRWGRNGRGPPMSVDGAWAFSLALFGFAGLWAGTALDLTWVRAACAGFNLGGFVIGIVAALRDQRDHRRGPDLF